MPSRSSSVSGASRFGVDGVRLQGLQGVRVDVAAVAQVVADVAGLEGGAAVVGGVEVVVARSGQGVEEAGRARAELVGEARIARPQQGLAVRAEHVGEAQARGDGRPLETGVAAVVMGGREQLGEDRVGRRGGGQVLAALAVVAQAGAGGEVPLDHGVLHVKIRVVGLHAGHRVAGDPQQMVAVRKRDLEAAAGQVEQGGLLGRAVAGAVLELMGERAGVEEIRGVGLELLLRALDLVQDEAVVPLEAGVAVRKRLAALGDELEAAVDHRVHAGEVEIVAKDLGVFHFIGGRVGTEFGLVPGGLLGPGRAGVAADLHLVALPGEQGGRVAGRQLGVDLGVPAFEGGLVAHVVDRRAGRFPAWRRSPRPTGGRGRWGRRSRRRSPCSR